MTLPPDILLPKLRALDNELLHHADTALVLYDFHVDAA